MDTKHIELTEEQSWAVSAMTMVLTGVPASEVLRDDGEENGPPRPFPDNTLMVGGYAGTGKTTVLKDVLEGIREVSRFKNLRHNIAVCAFTGKAVSVLRRKEVYQAQTLHSLMYAANEDPITKQVTFTKKRQLGDEEGPPYTGVIVDEASMLNATLFDDLLSYGLPVVFVGDHGQLEPIGDNPNVMRSPDIRLETIHRQAGNSPILKLAHAFREGLPVAWSSIPPGCGLKHERRHGISNLTGYDVILCGYNKTRNALNRDVRNLLGLEGKLVVGERLICLKNNRHKGVFNGMLFTIKVLKEPKLVTNIEGTEYEVTPAEVVDDDGRVRLLDLYLVKPTDEVFRIVTKYHSEKSDYPVDFILVDYGYALTAHKAQGSEWNRVLVVEEIHPEANAERWRYTAATRAAKQLTWVV